MKTTKAKKVKAAEPSKQQDQAEELHQILDYYRNRVENFEKERVQWFDKLDKLRIKQDQAHKVEWELKKRQEEKGELEMALHQCQAALYNEREKIMQMKESGD